MKRKPGRPPRVSGAPTTHKISLRVVASEREAWTRAAAADGLTLAEWVRAQASRKCRV